MNVQDNKAAHPLATSTRTIVCTVCPTGCEMTVDLEDGQVVRVAGNSCGRGRGHAISECQNPLRTLTTTVRACGGVRPLLPVRTNRPVPLARLGEMVRFLNGISVSAPVQEGSIVVADILGTGADVVASCTLNDV